MSLVAGSYERFIWGYKLKSPSNTIATATPTLTLAPQFSYSAHLSPITTLAVSSTVAASAASDDAVKLYDLTTSTELGSVLLHSSSATSLAFFPSSSFPRNLFAGARDGSFHIFDIDPFVLLKSAKAHRKAVNDIAVHFSGRVALTVGRDACLGMVNLVRGKRSFCCRLEKEAEVVEYCGGDGGCEKFFLCCGDQVSVHDSEDAKIVANFEAPKRILCAAPGEGGLIFTGGEDRGITAWDMNSGKVAYSIEDAHKTRVKGIVVLTKDGTSGAAENPLLVASASSDGIIRVWDIRATSKGQSAPLSEANTKSRLTCLAGSSIKSFKKAQLGKDVSANNSTEMEDAPENNAAETQN